MYEQVNVNLGERSYPIFIGAGELNTIGDRMNNVGLTGKVAVVTNPLVYRLFGREVIKNLEMAGFRPFVIKIPDGEEYKTLNVASSIYDKLVEHRLERGSSILALGGGVIGDIAGFAAATYLRGLPYIQAPTTLLAQVDSSVGGKTAVNHPKGKNLIGAFYQPKAVIIDIDVLKKLDLRDIKAGMAEIIKYGIIRDADFFSYLEDKWEEMLRLGDGILYAIKRSCEIKAEVVVADEREEGLRSILNFGHTFGHAIESVTEYKRYRHGEAVAIGMALAGEISYRLGLCNETAYKRAKRLISKAGLPTEAPTVPFDKMFMAMELDKKILDRKMRFVLMKDIGKVVIKELGKGDLQSLVST
jgi:3-dehydroquinate synthase